MKEKIANIKVFVCFYLTLPLFVFMCLTIGVKALDEMPQVNPTKETDAKNSDGTLLPSDSIEAEIGNPDGSAPILAKDLSKNYNILNSTNEIISEEELLAIKLPHEGEEPLVLVVHTHGTECYADATESFSTADSDGYYGFYTEESKTRTTDTEKNVIAIGEIFCNTLAEKGIRTIQSRIMHDKDDYNSAYANSRKTISEYLKKYPSIKYVIDLHRDSLGDSERIKTNASDISGCAQVMLVAGCHGNGVIYPIWKQNLSVALKYKKAMDEKYPSLSRPIYLRYSRYNLDLSAGSLLLEVGSCANSFDEAAKAARLAAECFAEMLQ